MLDDDDKAITLSREDLYELAWSKPMSELAKDFGISDVGLVKRCKRLGIPVPGRGYWARVDSGQAPYRPKLPKREPQWNDQSALTVAPSVGAYSTVLIPKDEDGDPPAPEPESMSAKITALSVVPSTSLVEALPAVKRTAVRNKHPRCSELTFQRGEKAGPVVALDVTKEALERALLLADTLLRAAGHLGWVFDDPRVFAKQRAGASGVEKAAPDTHEGEQPDEPYTGRLLVEGEQVAFRIEERLREEPRSPTAAELARERREYGYHAPRKVTVPTGAMRIVRLNTYRCYPAPDRRSWYDRGGKRVEVRRQGCCSFLSHLMDKSERS
jgi:hypothetical protein